MYSSSRVSAARKKAVSTPNTNRQGTRKARPQNTATLPKWCSQKWGTVSGQSAMDSNMHAKGMTQTMDRSCGSAGCDAKQSEGVSSSASRAGARVRSLGIPVFSMTGKGERKALRSAASRPLIRAAL